MEPKHFIGIDTYDPDNPAYCLTRHWDGKIEVILFKAGREIADFDEEVNNLARYFNATLIEEVDGVTYMGTEYGRGRSQSVTLNIDGAEYEYKPPCSDEDIIRMNQS